MFYLRFFDYFLLGCCSEARSLTNPLRKGLITDWGWSEALSLKYPSREGLITDWSWSGACAFPNPLIKASSGLRCFALQWWDSWKLQVRDDYISKSIQKLLIMTQLPLQYFMKSPDYWLELVWSTFPYTSFTEMPDYRLELFWIILLYKSFMKRPDYRLELFWSILLYKSSKKTPE